MTCGAVFDRSSRILLPATDSVTEGFEPEQPIMLAIRVRKDAIEEEEERKRLEEKVVRKDVREEEKKGRRNKKRRM